jgi:hypothetical protein
MFRLRTMLSISAGYAAGYVAGAKAGRPAYERIVSTVNRYGGDLGLPAVPPKLHEATQSATDKANEEIINLRDKVRDSGMSGRPEAGREQGPTVAP